MNIRYCHSDALVDRMSRGEFIDTVLTVLGHFPTMELCAVEFVGPSVVLVFCKQPDHIWKTHVHAAQILSLPAGDFDDGSAWEFVEHLVREALAHLGVIG